MAAKTIAKLAFAAGASGIAALAAAGPAETSEAGAESGRALAAPCVACHGADGNSLVPSYPNIAGQNERYLLQQMRLMRSGERPAPLMAGQLDNMSDQDLADLAAHYASQAPEVGQAKAAEAAKGEAIYRGGLLAKGVPACTACHAPDGSGNALAGFPHLSGQQVDYVVEQLRAYREGLRTTDEAYSGMMRQSVANLNDGELAALANYIRGLH